MTLDVVDGRNDKVGSIDLSDEVFGGPVDEGLVWESVVQQNASERRGTHATKTRGQVRGTGRKPWRQKGTGRARSGEVRNPLWRKGGTIFGPRPRSYAYALPGKVVRGALRAALTAKLRDGSVIMVEQFPIEQPRTKEAAELLAHFGDGARTLVVDRRPARNLELAARNLPGVRVVGSNRLTARDVAGAGRLLMTPEAVRHLEKVLAS